MVEGRNYTSNNSKLLKHLDKLQDLQDGKPVSPVMIHLALTNKCNLDCSYCCYGGRDKGQSLKTYQAMDAIDQFSKLGTKGLEITGGGDPLLHPQVNEIVTYGKFKDMSIGLITNGLAYSRFTEWDKLDWIRLSSHALNGNNPRLKERFAEAIMEAKKHPNLNVGSVHIYRGNDADLDNVVTFMEQHQIPTRITPDLTMSPESINYHMERVANLLENKYNAKFCFVSDFNFKTNREAKNCFMRFVKPYIHPDGFVYECPGASFSPENYCTVDDKYKICSIDKIVETYTNEDIMKTKSYPCQLCKYDYQNMLIEDVVRETKDNDFA